MVGCGVGLLFLVVGGSSEWKLPLALAATVLLSSYVIKIPSMWRQAPITAAIVIAAGLTHHSKLSGVEHGLHKVAEDLYGCLVNLVDVEALAHSWAETRFPTEIRALTVGNSTWMPIPS
jgi:hypothetical protein